jgi:PAS domain S-box-containing protein
MISKNPDPEIVELRNRLHEAEALLAAIRSGATDALMGETGVLHMGGAEKPYITFFSAMNEGGVTLDHLGAILHGNPCFAAMMGQAIETLRGQPFIDFVTADDRPRTAQLLQSPRTGACEVRLEVRQGEPLPVRLSLTTVDTEGQQYGCLVVTALKERVNAEAQLRQHERDLRAMYSHQQSMIEVERKRVSREVHDELGQILTALRMETSLLQRELQGNDKAATRTYEMLQLIESMFKSVRSIAGNLRPSTLDLGLVPAIEWLAQDFEKRWAIDCALDIGQRDIRIGEAYATNVFRIIQESLTNVARHARASSVSIALEQRDRRVHLEIHDNGCGFEADTSYIRGFGMIGMRERVQELGGNLVVHTAPDLGTQILIDLPLEGS